MSPESRRWQIGLLLGCALMLPIVLFTWLQGTPVLPWASTDAGMYLDFAPSGPIAMTVLSVEKGGPAYRAGLRAGDRINFQDLPFSARWRLRQIYRGYAGPAGSTARLVVHRGSNSFTTSITSRRIPPTWPSAVDLLSCWGALWSVLFVAVLAIRRPDSAEVRLLSLILLFFFGADFLTGLFVPNIAVEWCLQLIGNMLFIPVSAVALTILSSSVAHPLSRLRKAFAWIATIASAVVVLGNLCISVLGYLFALPVVPFYESANLYGKAVALAASLACALAAVNALRGAERTRVAWIVAAISPMWVYYALVVPIIGAFIPGEIPLDGALGAVFDVAFFAVPVLLTYAVLSRRSIDIGYVLNRATVFGAVSIFVLGVFVVVEELVSGWATGASRTASLAVNLAVALALGLSIRFIHGRIDHFVDRVFFRKRHEDETALRHFAREAAFITDAETLVVRTVQVVGKHTDAQSVEVFLKDGDSRLLSVNGERRVVDLNDPGILAMRTWHDPIEIHRYETGLGGEIAFPMLSRGALLGILVCGSKRDGQQYAPDEREALRDLAHGVGSALDTLRVEERDETKAILYQMRDSLEEIRRSMLHSP